MFLCACMHLFVGFHFLYFMFFSLLMVCVPLLFGIVSLGVHKHLFNYILVCIFSKIFGLNSLHWWLGPAIPGLIGSPVLLTLSFGGRRSGSSSTRCYTIGWLEIDVCCQVFSARRQFVGFGRTLGHSPWSRGPYSIGRTETTGGFLPRTPSIGRRKSKEASERRCKGEVLFLKAGDLTFLNV